MATTVAFGSNLVVDEGVGNVWLQVNRTGDLSGTTTVLIHEDWSRSSAEEDDIIFNPHVAGSAITYFSDSKSILLTFAPGVKSLRIPYSISNDIENEVAEKLYFSIVGASTGTTIGDDDANIQINASDVPIKLNVSNAVTVNEGDYAVFTISLSTSSNIETDFWVSTFYNSASSADGDYRGIIDERHTIPAGVTSVTISVKTYTDSVYSEGTESFSLGVDRVVGDNVIIDDGRGLAYINDTTVVPIILSVMDAGEVNEGDWVTFTIKLNQPAVEDIVFNYATYYGIYNEANAGGNGSDYEGQPSGIGVITAGKQEMNVYVQTFQDDIYNEGNERFALKVDSITQGNANIGNSTGVATIMDTTVVPPAPEPTTTPLTTAMLQGHAEAFRDLENDAGTSSATAIISGNMELSNVGKTLAAFNLLSDSIKNAITWFAGSVAYANQEELPLVTLTERQINIGLRLQSRVDSDQVATDPIEWTTAEVNDTDGLGLRAGDYVDGRLVIHQPWMALKSDGSYVSSSSLQGRFGGSDNLSHKGLISNSFDWSGVSKYAVVPYNAKIVNFDDSGDTESFNNGLGNFVTLKLDVDGKDIYLTFAHLKQYSVSDKIKQAKDSGSVIPIGTIIGETGQTGAAEDSKYSPYGYAIHLHMQAGTALLEGNMITDASVDSIPPVYMLGFNSSNVATMSDLGSFDPTGNFLVQDYGFPIGDWDPGESYVASNIYPTIPAQTFLDLNFGQGGDFVTPDNSEVINGTTGNDILVASDGDDVYNAGTGFDEIQYLGENSKLDNFAFETRTDGALLIGSSAFGSDITYGLEAVWFEASNQWFLINDLLNLPPATTGTWGDDVFVAATGNRAFFSLTGFDEIQYLGPYSLVENFVFIRESGNVTKAISTAFGEQILYDMEAVWLDASNQWNLIDDLLTEVVNGTIGDDVAIASDGNDVYYGDTGFDELQFFGIHASQDQFTFTKLTDGGIVVSSEAYGTDVLYGVEAVYFDASGQWSLTDNLFL